ncbi:hypothetical protein D1007_57285 [Hordeum vulgare]|nr:hypothetical protein D1007_57285 [Hordeum vulgare]
MIAMSEPVMALGEALPRATSKATVGVIPLEIGGVLPAAVGEDIGEAFGGAIGERGGGPSSLISGDGEGNGGASHRKWVVSFEDTSSKDRMQRFGFIKLHQVSRWITIRDEDNDILVGRYLQMEELPKSGQTMEIDGFRLIIGEPCEDNPGDFMSKVRSDLVSNSPRFGGRFWVLADQDSEEEAEEIKSDAEEITSDAIERMSLQAEDWRDDQGTNSQGVKAQPRIPRKALLKQKVRPWIGPLPKGKLAPITLSEFFPPAAWCIVKGRKKKNVVAARIRESAPDSLPLLPHAQARFHRQSFLNSATVAAGLTLDSSVMGLNGYVAQEIAHIADKSGSDCASPGYRAQDLALSTADPIDHVSPSPYDHGAHPRVLRRLNKGFPSLGIGRAARVPPPSSGGRDMAGRGVPRQPPASQPRPPGQGDRPIAKPVPDGHGAAQAGRPPGPASHAGEQGDQRGNQRGRWGNDGNNTYGDGHRGSSSYGAGRGHAPTINGGTNQGFCAPSGNFVPGTSGPPHHKRGGFRQNWAARGGDRKPRPPVPAQELQTESAVPIKADGPEPVKEAADPVDEQNVGIAKGDGGDRPSKWARKKEKMVCYRCSETGHFVSECKAELCVYCLKPTHGTAKCPLTIGSMPVVTIYGVSSQELMFFDSPAATATLHTPDAGFTGMVTVTRGMLTVEQVV